MIKKVTKNLTVIKIPTIIEEQGKARPEQKENINMAHIETKKGLTTLLKRYQEAGVTDDTMDASNSYKASWITTIKGCIKEGLAMDEVDYENTPRELKPLWRGLR